MRALACAVSVLSGRELEHLCAATIHCSSEEDVFGAASCDVRAVDAQRDGSPALALAGACVRAFCDRRGGGGARAGRRSAPRLGSDAMRGVWLGLWGAVGRLAYAPVDCALVAGVL